MEINELFCLGCNKYGQLGAGKKYHNQTFKIPKSIIFQKFVKEVACGVNHSAILTLQGYIYTMGSNMHGTLGQPSTSFNYSYSPILIQMLKNVSKICSGSYHMCAIADGNLYSWGKGLDGQLGNSSFTNNHTPKKIESFSDEVDEISCGANHTLVKTINRKCYGFGNGIYGQLGVGSNKNFAQPVSVKIDYVDQIAAGQNFSLFLKNTDVYGTGDNSKNQISHIIKKKCVLQPEFTGVTNVTNISAGKISVALSTDQLIYIWGASSHQTQSRKLKEQKGNIIEVKTGGNQIYYSTTEGKLFSAQVNEDKIDCSEMNIQTTAILDFAVGEKHSIVLGDIIAQTSDYQEIPKVLITVEETKMKALDSKKTSTKFLKTPQSQSSSQFESSIPSEHFSRTPSSIMKEPTNYLRQQKGMVKVCVHEFNGGQQRKDIDKLNKGNNISKNNSSHSVLHDKIDQLMTILDKSSRIQETTQHIELQRKTTRRHLNSSQTISIWNKENMHDQTSSRLQNAKTNKQLIMQLRQKQLKISELQQKLSRKQIEVECQKNLINMLRKMNCQTPQQ